MIYKEVVGGFFLGAAAMGTIVSHAVIRGLGLNWRDGWTRFALPIGMMIAGELMVLVSGCTPSHSSHIKYFGYAASGDDLASITATGSFCNFVEVHELGNAAATLAMARANKVKLVWYVEKVLWDGNRLFPDYAARWGAWRASNGIDAALGDTLGFYVVDEPTRKGMLPAEVEAATALVKSTYPVMPMIVIESGENLATFVVPSQADWIGFSTYGVDPATDAEYATRYDTLLSKRSRPDQKTIVVLDGWWSQTPHGNNGLTPDGMATIAQHYSDFATARPDVVAIAVFVWPPIPYPDPVITSVARPDWVAAHRSIAKGITGK